MTNHDLLDRGIRVLTNPAIRRPYLAAISSVGVGTDGTGKDRVALQVSSSFNDRYTAGALLRWAYLLDQPTVELYRYGSAGQVRVNVELYGVLDGDRLMVFSGLYDTDVADMVTWDGNNAVASLHFLRNIQVGTRTAVAS